MKRRLMVLLRRFGSGFALALTLAACSTTPPDSAAVHEAAWVFDAHADVVMPDTSASMRAADGASRVALDKLVAGGVDAVSLSLAVSAGPRTVEGRAAARAEVDAKLAAVRQRVAESNGRMVLATSAEALVAAHAAGQQAVLLNLQNFRSLEGRIDALDHFYQQGVRVFAPVHLGHNAFADSSRPLFIGSERRYEPTEEYGGLSALGRDAVRRINALGAVLDVSQLSQAATLQAAAMSTAPVIASHSNVRALSDVTRNLSDEEIDLIAARGGVIHVTPFKGYLVDLSDPALVNRIRTARREAGLPEAYSYPFELYWELDDSAAKAAFIGTISDILGVATIGRLIDHIDYLVERVGVEHVGIGTDFNHGGAIEGFADASDAPNVTAGLLQRGYSHADVAKIWGGNFLRVLRASEVGALR